MTKDSLKKELLQVQALIDRADYANLRAREVAELVAHASALATAINTHKGN